MKRSEFKTQMQDLMNNHLYYEHASDELVEMLMVLIEKSGLKPPKYSRVELYPEPWDVDMCGNPLAGHVVEHDEWESEDA